MRKRKDCLHGQAGDDYDSRRTAVPSLYSKAVFVDFSDSFYSRDRMLNAVVRRDSFVNMVITLRLPHCHHR
jgi:hypothetical protein